jgi:integrase
VLRLLEVALQLPTERPSSSLRPWVYHCLLGLLAVTGLRISEALDLKIDDVDLAQAVLTVHAAKLGRRGWCRYIRPRAPYWRSLRRRDAFLGSLGSTYLFVSTRGTRLDVGRVHRAFYGLSRQTGLRAPGVSRGPRLHDFRHRFAVRVLTRWYQEGIDPQRRPGSLSSPTRKEVA